MLATATGEVNAYTNLYDKYKICAFKVDFVPRANSFQVYNNVTSAEDNFILWTSLDYDDTVAPTDVQALVNYRNAKWTRGTAKHTRYVKYPHIVNTLGATGTGVQNAGNIRSCWIDAAFLGVQHLGIKWGCQPGGAAANKTYIDVILTAYVKWAGRR